MEQEIYTIQSNIEFILYYLQRIVTITNNITHIQITKENVDEKLYGDVIDNINNIINLYKQIDIGILQEIIN